MNLKKTAIALAVASVAAAPLAASADGSVYASARIGVQYTDTGGDDSMRIRGHASRMGMKGETDLGNGMTGHGKYEFAVATEGTGPNVSRRHAVVGVKGDFGNVFIGQTYHTWYNMIVAPVDQPWWNSGIGMIAYRGRTSEGLSYAGDFGAVNIGATIYMRGSEPEDDIDSTELAASFDAGVATIAVGVTSEESLDDDIIGITASGNAGSAYVAATYQMLDDDASLEAHVGIGSAYLQFGTFLLDDSDAAEPTSFTLGYTHSVGPRTTMWFEFTNTDADTDDSDDDYTAVHAVLKYDIL
ncbi:MAG: porin [Pseudomonadota bacterium]